MTHRTAIRGVLLLLLLGRCAYVSVDQIPCREDTDCPTASHCGFTGYCTAGTDPLEQSSGDAGLITTSLDAGSAEDAGSPDDGLDAGVPSDPDAGFAPAPDAGVPPGPDAGSPEDAGTMDAGRTPPDAGHSPPDAGHLEDAGHVSGGGEDAGPEDAGVAAGGACVDGSDATLLSQSSEQSAITSCAENNIDYMDGALYEPQALDCFEGTGLSDPCAQCVDTQATCVVQNCGLQCAGGTSSSGCQSCMDQNCTAAFDKCSGL